MRVYADVDGARLELLERPEYLVAHPNEQDDAFTPERCDMCALAVRPDTGELVLLWRCGRVNWSVSREDPNYERHRVDLQTAATLGWGVLCDAEEEAALMRDMLVHSSLTVQWCATPSEYIGVEFGGTVEEGQQWLRGTEAALRPTAPLLRIKMPCGHAVEYAHAEDVPVVDVPCSCGDPRHWFIKWEKVA